MDNKVLVFLVSIWAIVAISGCKADGDDSDRITDQPSAEIPGGVIPTPEPGTAALLLVGVGALWASTKQRPWRW